MKRICLTLFVQSGKGNIGSGKGVKQLDQRERSETARPRRRGAMLWNLKGRFRQWNCEIEFTRWGIKAALPKGKGVPSGREGISDSVHLTQSWLSSFLYSTVNIKGMSYSSFILVRFRIEWISHDLVQSGKVSEFFLFSLLHCRRRKRYWRYKLNHEIQTTT